MRRDEDRLRRYVTLVEGDLGRTLDGAWRCTLADDLVLRVFGPRWQGVVELDAEADEDDLIDYEAEDLDAALDFDAAETVADQVAELVCNTGRDWPTCPEHGERLEPEAADWTCPRDHVLAAVGRLELPDPAGD